MKCRSCSQSRYAMKVRTGDDFLEQIPPNHLVMKSLGFGRTRGDFVTDLRLWVSVYVGMSSDKWRGTDPCSEWYTVESTLCWMRLATDSQCSSHEVSFLWLWHNPCSSILNCLKINYLCWWQSTEEAIAIVQLKIKWRQQSQHLLFCVYCNRTDIFDSKPSHDRNRPWQQR